MHRNSKEYAWETVDVMTVGETAYAYQQKYGWTPHSEHTIAEESPKQYVDEMPAPSALQY